MDVKEVYSVYAAIAASTFSYEKYERSAFPYKRILNIQPELKKMFAA